MRQSPNRRMKARGRPHTKQRWYVRTLNRCGRFALAIIDFLAMASPSPRLAGEGHAEEFEQPLRFLVGLRRRHDADLQPAETVHFVVVDLRKSELLPEPQRIVPAPVERLSAAAGEVSAARQRKPGESLEEVPHAVAPEGDPGTDRVTGPKAELRDGALRLRRDRLLAGDGRQVSDGRIDRLGVGKSLTQADVNHDLADTRDLHGVRIAELLLQGRHGFFLVSLMKTAAHAPGSSCSRQWPQTRALCPLPSRSCLTRVTRSQ